jgi:hypothetical protein
MRCRSLCIMNGSPFETFGVYVWASVFFQQREKKREVRVDFLEQGTNDYVRSATPRLSALPFLQGYIKVSVAKGFVFSCPITVPAIQVS